MTLDILLFLENQLQVLYKNIIIFKEKNYRFYKRFHKENITIDEFIQICINEKIVIFKQE